MQKENLLAQLRKIGVIERREVTLRSGEVSNIYCDMRMVFGNPELLNALADEMAKLIPGDVDCIAASGYGGLPLGAVIASRTGRKLIGVRGAAKDHGKSGRLAGYMPTKHDRVVVIDDVLTSGSSIKETHAGLIENGITAELAVVAVKRADPELPIPVHSVFTIEEIVGT